MKKGIIPESVLIRSVLKIIHNRRQDVIVGPAVGQDCAALCVGADEALVLSSDPITGTSKEIGRFGAHMKVSLVNDGPVTFWLEAT